MKSESLPALSHSPTSIDEISLRGLYDRLIHGWNSRSGHEFAGPFMEDGDFIAFDGRHFKGREQIRNVFHTRLPGIALAGRIQSVRFLGPEVALIHATGGAATYGKSSNSPERDLIQTIIAVKNSGEWRLAVFQATRVRSIDHTMGGIFAWILTDLLWRLRYPGT